MPKIARELTALEVKHLGDGTFNVGGAKGLYIRKTPHQSIFFVRYTDELGRHDFVLGNFPTMSLKQARLEAHECWELIRKGKSPIIARQQERQARKERLEALAAVKKQQTFRSVAEEWVDDRVAHNYWSKNRRGEQATRGILNNHIYPSLGNINIEEITPELVRDCLTPIWQKFPATAKKVKTVIHKVLQWAIAMHKRENRENPAAFDGALGVLIEPLQNNIKPAENHAACAIDEIPRLFVEMNEFDSMSAYACMFAILTAARSQAVRLAEWDEINFDKKIWIIPVEHDKVKTPNRDRTIFLSDEAIALLKRVPKISGVSYIFPSRQGGHLSDVTITMFLRRLHKQRLASDGIGWVDPDKSAMLKKPCIITFHGTARASFRTWAKNDDLGNNRKFDQEAVEYCLLHQKDDGYNKAYDRARLAKERIKIMQAWGKYCFSLMSTEK